MHPSSPDPPSSSSSPSSPSSPPSYVTYIPPSSPPPHLLSQTVAPAGDTTHLASPPRKRPRVDEPSRSPPPNVYPSDPTRKRKRGDAEFRLLLGTREGRDGQLFVVEVATMATDGTIMDRLSISSSLPPKCAIQLRLNGPIPLYSNGNWKLTDLDLAAGQLTAENEDEHTVVKNFGKAVFDEVKVARIAL